MCPPDDDPARDGGSAPDGGDPATDGGDSAPDGGDPAGAANEQPSETVAAARNQPAGFDQEAMYAVVRAAMKDAMLDVIGTVLLVGISMVVLWVGATVVIAGGGSPQSLLFGLPVVVFALYLAASAVDLIPSVWEWL